MTSSQCCEQHVHIMFARKYESALIVITEWLAFSSAWEKYQWYGITPHSEDRFCTVLKNSTTPSGHTSLLIESIR